MRDAATLTRATSLARRSLAALRASVRATRARATTLAALCLLAMLTAPASATQDERVFSVGAASSLGGVLQASLATWRASDGAPGDFLLGSSSAIARNIEQGAPIDLFLCADTRWMDHLEERALIAPGSRRVIATNRLAIVRPLGSSGSAFDPDKPTTPFDIRRELVGRRWATADPTHVPLGAAAQNALLALGLWADVSGELISAASAAEALGLVERGEVEWAVVYLSDALASTSLELVARIPESSAPPMDYVAALTPGADPAAAEFLAWLGSAEGQQLFMSKGFGLPNGGALDSAVVFPEGMLEGLALRAASAAEALSRDTKMRAAAPRDTSTRGALATSLRVSLWATLVVALPGIALGWLLARKRFPGRLILDALVHLPLVLTPVVVGYLLLLLVGRQGVLGPALEALDLQIAFAFPGAVLASAVIALPLVVRSVRTAVELVDPAMEDAAAVLGAGPWRRLMTVTLPLAMPGVVAGLVLGFARSLGEFGATMTLASSFPGSTRTLPLAIYGAIQQPGGEEAALRLTAFSVTLSFLALAASELFLRHLRRRHGARP